MGTKLEENLVKIFNEKNDKIIPSNIKSGVSIFNVAGTINELKGQTKTVTPTTATQTVTPDTNYNGLTAVTVNGDANLVAENIKAGVTIFDIEGIHEGTGSAVKGVFEGETSILEESIEDAVIEKFKVTGQTIQKAVPTIAVPVEIQNVTGNIVVKVTNGSDEQSVVFPLGSQLLSNGSYIDDDGIHIFEKQQVLTGNETINNYRTDTSTGYCSFSFAGTYTHIADKYEGISPCKCNYLPHNSHPWGNDGEGIWLPDENPYIYFTVPISVLSDYSTASAQITSVKSWLSNLYANGKPMIIQVRLPEEELVSFTTVQQEAWNNIKQLVTYARTTYISTENKMKLGGKSTQEETPTSDNPVEIQNMSGDLTINVTGGIGTQTITFPLGEHLLRKDDYLANNGIHTLRKQMIFNGTEDWAMSPDIQSDVCEFDLTLTEELYHTINDTVGEGTCSHFPVLGIDLGHGGNLQINYEGLTIYWGHQWDGCIKIAISKEKATSLSEFKAWLASNPVTLEYKLFNEEPIIPYTEEQQTAWDELKKLTSYGGVADIEIDIAIKPILSGKYYMEVSGGTNLYNSLKDLNDNIATTAQGVVYDGSIMYGIFNKTNINAIQIPSKQSVYWDDGNYVYEPSNYDMYVEADPLFEICTNLINEQNLITFKDSDGSTSLRSNMQVMYIDGNYYAVMCRAKMTDITTNEEQIVYQHLIQNIRDGVTPISDYSFNVSNEYDKSWSDIVVILRPLDLENSEYLDEIILKPDYTIPEETDSSRYCVTFENLFNTEYLPISVIISGSKIGTAELRTFVREGTNVISASFQTNKQFSPEVKNVFLPVIGTYARIDNTTAKPENVQKGYTTLIHNIPMEGTYEFNYEEAGTITPEEYTEAQTQINDLFGEEVSE